MFIFSGYFSHITACEKRFWNIHTWFWINYEAKWVEYKIAPFSSLSQCCSNNDLIFIPFITVKDELNFMQLYRWNSVQALGLRERRNLRQKSKYMEFIFSHSHKSWPGEWRKYINPRIGKYFSFSGKYLRHISCVKPPQNRWEGVCRVI